MMEMSYSLPTGMDPRSVVPDWLMDVEWSGLNEFSMSMEYPVGMESTLIIKSTTMVSHVISMTVSVVPWVPDPSQYGIGNFKFFKMKGVN